MTADRAERSFSPFLVPAIGIGFVVLFALLFWLHSDLYWTLLRVWMLTPFPHPFIDWQFVPAAAECWSRGVNVYVATPCYDLMPTMPHPYSPLWLRFSFLPSNPAAVAVFGVGWAVLFWLAQASLPAPRTVGELGLTLLVVLSSLTAFAIERGNIDLVIFLLTVLGCRLWIGPLPLRLLAYAIFLLAGLLKFYPLVLLSLALRERPRVFLLVTIVATSIVALAAFDVREELVAVSRNIPKGSYFTDWFGSVNLPFGLPYVVAYVTSKLSGQPHSGAWYFWISKPTLVVLCFVVAFGAAWLAFVARLRIALAALEARRQAALLAGALLLCGCFFTGQSVGYRGIFLILLLPGLFELQRTASPIASRCIQAVLCGIVFIAWVLTIEYFSKQFGLTRSYDLGPDGFGFLHWVLHELVWWLIVTVQSAVLMSFVANSTMVAWLMATWRGRQPERGQGTTCLP